MLLAGALGLNLWVVAVAVPLLLGAAAVGREGAGGLPLVIGLAILGPALLGLGTLRRSAALLLAGVPLGMALPQAFLVGGAATPRAPLPAAALSLLAYLLAAARALHRLELGGAPTKAGGAHTVGKPLAAEATPVRWRRRARVYGWLTAIAALMPLVLVWDVDVRRVSVEEFALGFGARADEVRALVTAAVGLAMVAVFRAHLLAPLESHLSNDRDLLQKMEIDRKRARRGRPRALFYLYVAAALAAMLAVVWHRAR